MRTSTTMLKCYLKPHLTPSTSTSFQMSAIASIYGLIPARPPTSPIQIAVISLGGGLFGTLSSPGADGASVLTDGDVQTFWSGQGISSDQQPTVRVVLVDGAVNRPSSDLNASIENTIDVETIGTICHGSNVTITMFLGRNSFTGFLNVFRAAIASSPTVISCSWGAPENVFSSGALAQFDSLFQTAASAGINICCASGDNGSSDGLPGTNVDFPAASPNVVSCGGTRLVCNELVYDGTTVETAWSSGGGGLSKVFVSPPYQALIPAAPGFRASPDVALNADPQTGVNYRVNATNYVVGGTSIVSPAVAAFIANAGINYFFNPRLYACPLLTSSVPASPCFNDIVSGSNGAYTASAGFDLCTGWGSLSGARLLSVLSTWVSVSSITLTAPVMTSVQVGRTLTVSATALPSNASCKTLLWRSSNTRLASVSSTGVVTGVAVGTVSISATSFENSSIVFNVSLSVVAVPIPPPPPPPPGVAVTSVNILPPLSRSLRVGGRTICSAYVRPANATNKHLTWTSSNNLVASVTASGVVTAVRRGNCTITASSFRETSSARVAISVK